MAETTKIPADLWKDFESSSIEKGEGEKNVLSNPATAKSLEQSLSWVVGQADKIIKKNGYEGLGDLDQKDFAKLISIVLERNAPAKLMEKSPEATLIGMCGIIVANNLLIGKKGTGENAENE